MASLFVVCGLCCPVQLFQHLTLQVVQKVLRVIVLHVLQEAGDLAGELAHAMDFLMRAPAAAAMGAVLGTGTAIDAGPKRAHASMA